MAEDFGKAVEDGLRLAKRIYFGKDRSVAPPKPPTMLKSAEAYLPTSPMVYAVISDPSIVDNPDIPSYQPYVHGRCDPPALIPLQMNQVAMEVNCYMDTAFVSVTGTWRVHCVMGSRSCCCWIAIPMGEQGSILSVEVEVPKRSFSTHLIGTVEKEGLENYKGVRHDEKGGFLNPHIFTLTVPQVDGGSNISITTTWSQKLLYQDGQYTLNVPFSFPEFVTPAGKKMPKKEKIQLSVNAGTRTEVICKSTSHPLKERSREVGKLSFFYESDVLTWSSNNFIFSYGMSSRHTFGNLLLQSPPIHDADQREMFCFQLYPGTQESKKVFQKEVVFVIDISGSMRGKPIEDAKMLLSAALSKLEAADKFNIIAFNGETFLFSSSMELATKEAIENAAQWIDINFVAGGSTNILAPLTKAMDLLSDASNSLPMILLVTDGTVEDEKHICETLKSRLKKKASLHPRIHTFGIGSFCNHYFLQMLAILGRGYHDMAYVLESVEPRMERFFSNALSVILADISLDINDDLDYEVYPAPLPDMLSASPLILSGRYRGKFPETVKVRGTAADMSNFTLDLKVENAKDVPIDKVFARQQIDLLTSQAWFLNDKQLEDKVVRMSIQSGVTSEYTRMALAETLGEKKAIQPAQIEEALSKVNKAKHEGDVNVVLLRHLGLGFGNLSATADNSLPGREEPKLPEAAEKFVMAASNCCSKVCGACCCMCCIQACSRINNQCAIVLTQIITSFACLGCISCCELCCSGQDGG
ncbi:unnamed protein product [Rhodiola kirilowii]